MQGAMLEHGMAEAFTVSLCIQGDQDVSIKETCMVLDFVNLKLQQAPGIKSDEVKGRGLW